MAGISSPLANSLVVSLSRSRLPLACTRWMADPFGSGTHPLPPPLFLHANTFTLRCSPLSTPVQNASALPSPSPVENTLALPSFFAVSCPWQTFPIMFFERAPTLSLSLTPPMVPLRAGPQYFQGGLPSMLPLPDSGLSLVRLLRKYLCSPVLGLAAVCSSPPVLPPTAPSSCGPTADVPPGPCTSAPSRAPSS